MNYFEIDVKSVKIDLDDIFIFSGDIFSNNS